MLYVILLIVGFGIYEISKLSKQNKKKEIAVWFSFAVVTLIFTIYYFTTKNETSFVRIIMNIFNIEY